VPHVVIHASIRADPGDLRAMIDHGFSGIDATGVEVHLEPCRTSRESFSGRAYGDLPARARTRPGTVYLVRLRIPRVPRNRAYPKTDRYPKRKTSPWITVHSWRERFVALVAHEAFHVHQFREGLRRSEVHAERWALRRLDAWAALQNGAGRPLAGGEELESLDTTESAWQQLTLDEWRSEWSGPLSDPRATVSK
jgi:hypothetical protein